MAPWPSGKAEDCKSFTPSSNLGGASKRPSDLEGLFFASLMESMLDIFGGPWYIAYMESSLYIMLLYLEVYKGGGKVKNRLEEIRKQQGITQEELASVLEVSRQTIGSLENGRYNPSILLAFKIARYFGMKIEDIFIYEEDQ